MTFDKYTTKQAPDVPTKRHVPRGTAHRTRGQQIGYNDIDYYIIHAYTSAMTTTLPKVKLKGGRILTRVYSKDRD